MPRVLKEDWEFNVLEIYNYRRAGHLQGYFTFVRENHDYLPGDVVEAGVYRGKSLLAMALMLQELGSSKKVYGYDTWSGFPPIYSPEDKFETYERLFAEGRISAEHLEKARLQVSHRGLGSQGKKGIDSKNISLSGDFSSVAKSDLEAKIAYFGLQNVVLVEGPFSQTMGAGEGPSVIMAGLIDADLYASYQVALPFIWPRITQGGYLYLDEYYSLKFPGARIASDEYFSGLADKPQRHDDEFGHFERWYVRKIFSAQAAK